MNNNERRIRGKAENNNDLMCVYVCVCVWVRDTKEWQHDMRKRSSFVRQHTPISPFSSIKLLINQSVNPSINSSIKSINHWIKPSRHSINHVNKSINTLHHSNQAINQSINESKQIPQPINRPINESKNSSNKSTNQMQKNQNNHVNSRMHQTTNQWNKIQPSKFINQVKSRQTINQSTNAAINHHTQHLTSVRYCCLLTTQPRHFLCQFNRRCKYIVKTNNK